MDYLKHPMRTNTQNILKSKIAQNTDWEMYISNIQSRTNTKSASYKEQLEFDQNIMEKYLTYLFKSGKEIEYFMKFIDRDYLIQVYEETLFLQGKEVAIDKDNALYFQNMVNRVAINIPEYNKEVRILTKINI